MAEYRNASGAPLAIDESVKYYIIQVTNIATDESQDQLDTVRLGSEQMGAGSHIKRLGIQAPPGSFVTFNGDDGKFFENFTHNMMIGKVGIFELNMDFDDIDYSQIEQVEVKLPEGVKGDIIIDAIYVKAEI